MRLDSYKGNPLLREAWFGLVLLASVLLHFSLERTVFDSQGDSYVTSAAWALLRGGIWGAALLAGLVVYLARWKLARGATLPWRIVAWIVGPYAFATWIVQFDLTRLTSSPLASALTLVTWWILAYRATTLSESAARFYFARDWQKLQENAGEGPRREQPMSDVLFWHAFMLCLAAAMGYMARLA